MSAAAISAPLADLFEAYRRAIDEDKLAWDEISRLDELPELKDRPWPKVQVGRLIKGRNDDGTEIFDPIFAYNAADIEKKIETHRAARLSFEGTGPGSEERRKKVHEFYASMIANKEAELQALVDQRRKMEDAAGFTAAMEVANETCAKVKALEAKIIGYVALTIADAAAIAAWVIAGMADDALGYLSDAAPIDALKSLAKAGASNV